MKHIKDITRNPVYADLHEKRRKKIVKSIIELELCPRDNYLSIYEYLESSPRKYYSHRTFDELYKWLMIRDKKSRDKLQEYLKENNRELDIAFRHLEEINRAEWHEEFKFTDDYFKAQYIDRNIHPTYLKLAEGVFKPIMHLVTYFRRLDRQKGTNSIDLYNIVEDLKKTNFRKDAELVDTTIRNGIGHGNISYLKDASFGTMVKYQDNKGNQKQCKYDEIVGRFDSLLDSCNGMSLALSVFLLNFQENGYALVPQIFHSELRSETLTEWWEYEGSVPYKILNNISQLNIFIRCNTTEHEKALFSAFSTGVLAEYFVPGYQRYHLTLRAKNRSNRFIAFDGEKLKELRNKTDAKLIDYKGTIVDTLFFLPTNHWLAKKGFKLWRLWEAFKITFTTFDWGDAKIEIPAINVRNSKIHRNGYGCVVRAAVHIKRDENQIDQKYIRRWSGRIRRKVIANARSQLALLDYQRYLPIVFARITLFAKDHRTRRLINYGLGPDLIGTIQVNKTKLIKIPDIGGSTVEQLGKTRIAWNKAWLEKKLPNVRE